MYFPLEYQTLNIDTSTNRYSNLDSSHCERLTFFTRLNSIDILQNG